jgi:uncharacterized protein
MKWTRGESRGNIDDLRGRTSVRPGGGLGGLGGIPIRMSGGGLVILLIFLAVRYFMSGSGPSPSQEGSNTPAVGTAQEEELVDFTTFVFNDAQRVWGKLLPGKYEEARLAIFREGVDTGCGYAGAEVGPFYCPADQRVYIDLSFFSQLRQRFGAPGDFAQAYVIAHEVGHHVQRQLGIERKVRAMQEHDPSKANELSVKMELQADCFAGMWGHSTDSRKLLESGDVEEALGAATAIGDDRLQKQAGARVNPESWTHGSSEQRVHWFRRGLENGSIDACDTFR